MANNSESDVIFEYFRIFVNRRLISGTIFMRSNSRKMYFFFTLEMIEIFYYESNIR